MATDKVKINIILAVLLALVFLYSVFITLTYYKNNIVQQSYNFGVRDGIDFRNQQIIQDLQNNGFTVLNVVAGNSTNQTQRVVLIPQQGRPMGK